MAVSTSPVNVRTASPPLNMLQSVQPDVAVIDFNLPKLFSLELVRRIRESGAPTRVPDHGLEGRPEDGSGSASQRRKWLRFEIRATGITCSKRCTRCAAGSIYVSPELQFERIFMTPRRSEPEDPLETLSSREYQVFQLMIEGIRAKEIACRLNLSPKTVDTYRASLMRKLDIHDVPWSGQVRDSAGLNVGSLSAVLLVRW